MKTLPKSFLSRIAEYPSDVQEALGQPLTPALVGRHVQVLHGRGLPAEDRAEALTDRPADVLLTRLLQSSRFAERLSRFFHALRRPEGAGAAELIDTESTALVAPLAAPGAPYAWKLAEISRAPAPAGEGKLAPGQAAVLLDLVALHRVMETTGTAGLGIARALLAAAEAGDDRPAETGAAWDRTPDRALRVAEALLRAAGTETALCRVGDAPPAAPVPALHVTYARHRIEAAGGLSGLDRDSLPPPGPVPAQGAQGSQAAQGITLHPPVPLRVRPAAPLTSGAEARWQSLAAAGLVDGPIESLSDSRDEAGGSGVSGVSGAAWLEMRGDLAVSPLCVAYLRTARPTGPVPLIVDTGLDDPSWRRGIAGYPRSEAPVPVGRLVPPARDDGRAAPETAGAAWRIAAHPAGDVAGMAVTDPADAYAFVVRLDADTPLPAWDNLDRCHVEARTGREGLAALARRLREGAFDRAVVKKPVILVGAVTPDRADWLTGAVARHWAYGGRLPTTALAVSYDPAQGRFDLSDLSGAETGTGEQLTRLLAAPFSTVPLAFLADPGSAGTGTADALPGWLDWIDDHLLVLREADGIGVAATGGPLPEAACLRLARRLAPERTGGNLRAAAAAARVGRAEAEALDPAVHWPVDRVLGRMSERYRRIETLIAGFAQAPAPALAERILGLLAAPDLDHRSLAGPMRDLALALAAEPDVLPALPARAVETFLARARHLGPPALDAVAGGLAVLAPEIVGDRPQLVLPLMEMLALGLPPAEVEAAFVALAETALRPPAPTYGPEALRDAGPMRRMRFRLAAAAQRYAGPAAQARLALLIARDDPDILRDPRLLRQFRALPGHPALAPLLRRAGADFGAAIRRSEALNEAFRTALTEDDRPRLEALLGDAGRLSEIDVTGWLDGLRAYSNELRRLALPVAAAVPPGGGLQRRKLMAAIFQDPAALRGLEAGGFLEDGSEISALCRNAMDDNAALDAWLARRFEGSGLRPIGIAGRRAAEVFANAGRLTAGAPPSDETGRVTAVVSAWNPDPELLGLALASLRAQTHGDVEIVLVDDASGADGRAAIDAACAADPDIRLIRLTENSGPYAGRNLALSIATGEFLAIQDADDWSHPERFARQIAAFRADPRRQLVTAGHVRIDEGGRVQMEAGFSVVGDGPMSSMFRRAAFAEAGGFAAVRSRGDIEMRDRIRQYFGIDALHDLGLPLMLCFAAATTLSQRVRRDLRDHLQLFRSHIDRRPPLDRMRQLGQRFDPAEVAVPHALRAPADPARTIIAEDTP